jgi:hypothetical protein
MIEHDIERVLEGLGRTEAPRGLEERVLRAMTARQSTSQRGFAFAWVAVAALVVTGVLIAVSKQRESALAIEEQKTAQAGAFDTSIPTHHFSPAQVSPAFRMNLPTHVIPDPSFERAGLQSRRDASSNQSALAAEGMFIPPNKLIPIKADVAEEAGFPAPPAPLTDQERLLLRLARKPNEATIAMFDPTIREERAAAEKEEFDFLNPPRPVETDQPTDSNLTEEKTNDRSQNKQ